MVLAVMLFVLVGMVDNGTVAMASSNKIVYEEKNKSNVLKPGETSSFNIPFHVVGEYMLYPIISITPDENAPFSVDNTKLIYRNMETEVTSMNNLDKVNAVFDIKTDEDASIGTYKAEMEISYITYSIEGETRISVKSNLYFNILEEKAPIQLTIAGLTYNTAWVDSKIDLKFKLKNEGDIKAYNVYFNVNYDNSKQDIGKNYTSTNIKVGDMDQGATKDITLPISILATATAGSKPLTVNFTYKQFGNSEPKTSSYDIAIQVKQKEVSPSTEAPYLQFEDITYDGGLKPGKAFALKLKLRNDGDIKASNIKVSIDESSLGKDTIIKDYLTDTLSVNGMKEEDTQTVSIPLTVSKQSIGGLVPVKINVSYSDADGDNYQLSNTIYVDVAVVKEDVVDEEKKELPKFIITNVGQDAFAPSAGDRINVFFDIENKGVVDAINVKIATTNLTSTTFIPVNEEPFIYIDKLAAGEKTTIQIPLILSDDIPEGLNYVGIEYSYEDGTGSASFNIPVKDVINEVGTISKPKLIISKYVADIEQLRAGSVFNFTFDLYNTNAHVTAKNIKITITQAENIFSVTQGSNSFFIDQIGPGETVSKTLEMKVKADAVTKAYPLALAIEYEYDVLEPNPTTGELVGEVQETEELNLQAVENARPVADNINVYSYDGQVTIGNPAMLGFEFYNMGKSALNNVIVYVEGDFTKSDGSMYFIGSVGPSMSSYVEFEVLANMEGLANGLLRITFEDSNGDLVETTKEFSTDVFPPQEFIPDMGGDPGMEVLNPAVEGKKAILATWLFVIIQVVIFIVFIPVTRKIVISIYKGKLRRKEDSLYE